MEYLIVLSSRAECYAIQNTDVKPASVKDLTGLIGTMANRARRANYVIINRPVAETCQV